MSLEIRGGIPVRGAGGLPSVEMCGNRGPGEPKHEQKKALRMARGIRRAFGVSQ